MLAGFAFFRLRISGKLERLPSFFFLVWLLLLLGHLLVLLLMVLLALFPVLLVRLVGPAGTGENRIKCRRRTEVTLLLHCFCCCCI